MNDKPGVPLVLWAWLLLALLVWAVVIGVWWAWS